MSEYVVASVSGGKDSTAMLLMMLERGERIDEVVACDTGMEFPELYEHLDKLEAEVGIPFTRLSAGKTFEHLMFDHVLAKGRRKGERGYGWPRPNARWCTSKLKTEVIERHLRGLSKTRDVVQCVGIAADEAHRVRDKRYPLVEYGVSEAEALAYCYERGYDWGGLYEHFGRVSCWCCPLQTLGDLRALRRLRPELWSRLREMDEASVNDFRVGSRGPETIADLDARFEAEEMQTRMEELCE